MTITRDGHEYELTYEEKVKAYYEVQHYFDTQDILDQIRGLSDEKVMKYYGITKEQFTNCASDMADLMRQYIEDYDDYWIGARDTAIRTAIDHSVFAGD